MTMDHPIAVGQRVFVEGSHEPATIVAQILCRGKLSHYEIRDFETRQVYTADHIELRPCTGDEWDGRIFERTPDVEPAAAEAAEPAAAEAAECRSVMKELFGEDNATSSSTPRSPPRSGRGTKRDPSQELGGSQEPKAPNRCEYPCNEALNDKEF